MISVFVLFSWILCMCIYMCAVLFFVFAFYSSLLFICFPIWFLDRKKEDMVLSGWGGEEGFREVRGGKSMIGIYHKEKIFSIKNTT